MLKIVGLSLLASFPSGITVLCRLGCRVHAVVSYILSNFRGSLQGECKSPLLPGEGVILLFPLKWGRFLSYREIPRFRISYLGFHVFLLQKRSFAEFCFDGTHQPATPALPTGLPARPGMSLTKPASWKRHHSSGLS